MPQTPERREYQREYRQRNREKLRAYKREYYLRNRENLIERQREYHQRNREYVLASFAFNRHGLQPGQWAALWAAQDGRCYLCGEELDRSAYRKIHLDHDHSHCPPGKSCRICQRGLACTDCNHAIGLVRDDPARLRRMADALELAKQAVARRIGLAGEQLSLDEGTAP